MLVRIILILLSLAALSREAAVPVRQKAELPDCKIYSLLMCTREHIPVCGSDGKTYANKCMLCFENLKQTVIISVARLGRC